MIVSHTDAAFGLTLGLAAILMGCFGEKFYAFGPGQRPTERTRTIPKWVGRTWCIGLGSILVFWNFRLVLGPWNSGDIREAFRLVAIFCIMLLLSFVVRELKSRFISGRGLFREHSIQHLFPKE